MKTRRQAKKERDALEATAVAEPEPRAKGDAGKEGGPAPVLLVDQGDKWRKWWTRTYTTVGMIAGFIAIIYFGHLALVTFIIVLQVMGFREILQIRHEKLRMDRLPADVPIAVVDWYLFFMFQYFFVGLVLIQRFPSFFMLHPLLTIILNHHSLICFSFLVVGVVAFVWTLRKGFLKMQFKQLAWCFTCLLAMLPSSFHIANIFEGMIWFLLPCSIIVCNDIAAFIWGFWLGRTPLIALSPKKTWEGFIGAFFSTLAFAWVLAWVLVQFDFFICPKIDMLVHPAHCPAQSTMTLTTYELPGEVVSVFGAVGLSITSVTVYPMQLHALVLAAFGSLIAPFGGFAASGFKRAWGIKDFGDLFPGHGGIIDRMDCQVIMGGFAFVYHTNFIKTWATVNTVMAAIAALSPDDQMLVYQNLRGMLSEA